MGEFFKGWRRKTGLVTLAMACVLMVGWMRSYVTRDWITTKRGSTQYFVGSRLGGIFWDRWTLSRATAKALPDLPIQWVTRKAEQSDPKEPFGKPDVDWRRSWLGFDFVEATMRYPRTAVSIARWTFPYWSLVLPLTLLSAWLILGKPRKAKAG